MPKKLKIDSLKSEIGSVTSLLESARRYEDIAGEFQLETRLEKLKSKLEELKVESSNISTASVALFFGGSPVLGSQGIAAEFAGHALEQFQTLISKIFATNENGQMGQRGVVPFKSNSELMVTGLARGSFGFVLDEMSDQTDLEESQLIHTIDKVAKTLEKTASADEAEFEKLLEGLDQRILIALRDFFINLDTNKATLRLVEKDLDISFDSSAIHRARSRTEATSIDEETIEVSGKLVGYLPEHRSFELIRSDSGSVIFGSVSKEAAEQLSNLNESAIDKPCLIEIIVKTIAPLNRPPRKIIRLVEFLRFS